MISMWILTIIAILCGIGAAVFCVLEGGSKPAKVGRAIACLLVAALIAGGCMYWLYGSEAGARERKTFQTNYGGGIERTVSVYDVGGELIKEYTGRFDVSYDTSRIIFDDEQGKRHIIYYMTGTVIIDEN